MKRLDMDHRCSDSDCPFIGQRTSSGCGCHKTREQMLEIEVISLRDQLYTRAGNLSPDYLLAIDRFERESAAPGHFITSAVLGGAAS
jgi:hypothetical protein